MVNKSLNLTLSIFFCLLFLNNLVNFVKDTSDEPTFSYNHRLKLIKLFEFNYVFKKLKIMPRICL